MPSGVRHFVNVILKLIRRYFIHNKALPTVAPVRESDWHIAIETLEINFGSGKAIQRSTAICLTHDVDTRECFEAIPKLVRLEQEYGIPCTYNFLTDWEYTYSVQLARSLLMDGFEVGMHGVTHDIAIGFRPRSVIKDHISKAIKKMEVPVIGYRAPAFAISEVLLEVLDELGFRYDSSTLMWHPLYPSIGLSFPYQYPSRQLWEIPITIEDSMLFGDFRLNEGQAIRFVINTMEEVCSLGGVCTLNIHPKYAKQYPIFFKGLLEAIRSLSRIAELSTMANVIAKKN